MILVGIVIGPSVLNVIDGSVLSVSAEIRKMALVIILLRAGLKLSPEDLKKVGRPAILMCFVPATVELIGMLLLAPRILGVSVLEAAIMGAVVAAVSPAVIVPKMIKLIDDGYGTGKGIPQMILAGASVDDVYVIVLFTTFTGLAQGEGVSVGRLLDIPVSIIVGVIIGILVGYILTVYFENVHIRDTIKVMIVLAVAFLLTVAEDEWGEWIPFASLIAVMSMGLRIKMGKEELAVRLSRKYDKMWIVAEIFLFVLVGASVAIDSVKSAGPKVIILIFGVLLFRMIGVWLCLLGTRLNTKERIFSMLAYTPKATVQAAIGGLPLAMGIGCGEIVLTVSVIAILITAPLGAFAIDITYKDFLEKQSI